jgi:oligopeptide transport system ATP-binding protein
MKNLLDINGLKTIFKTYQGTVHALNGVSFSVKNGEALGIVGESGSGKSVSMLSLMRLLSENGKVVSGEINFDGKDMNKLNKKEIQSLRGDDIGMIFQDPMTSLNPLFTIGYQLTEAIKRHRKLSKEEIRKNVINMLELVGIPSPEKRLKNYPHEFSGGMRQRVMIAMALLCEPKLLIADEPTTALDVTIQAQIIELLKDIKEEMEMSIILITHDLGLVTEICERVIIMYGGMIVEEGNIFEIYNDSKHPYTTALLNSIPRLNMGSERLSPIEGSPPDLSQNIKGCPFAERCPNAMKVCVEEKPSYYELSETHKAACWILHDFYKEEKNEAKK